MRFALAASAVATAAGSARAQPAGETWTVTEALDEGAVLYTARTVGAVEVVSGLFRVGESGTTAEAVPGHACPPGCMVEAVRVDAEAGDPEAGDPEAGDPRRATPRRATPRRATPRRPRAG